jgi:hypothetical protein
MSINYGVLQGAIKEHGADSPLVATMCELLGTTLAKARERIDKSADKIKRDRKRAANEELAASMSKHLNDMVLVDKTTKSARDWAVIAHDRLEKAKELRAGAKPITAALETFREGKLAELVSQGKAEAGAAFSFRVVTDKEGNRIVSWTPKGARGSGGGRPAGTLIGALDGETMSWTLMYQKVMGKAYEGDNSHSKQLVTDALKTFDWARVTYNPSAGAESAIEKLAGAGAIAVEGLGNE